MFRAFCALYHKALKGHLGVEASEVELEGRQGRFGKWLFGEVSG